MTALPGPEVPGFLGSRLDKGSRSERWEKWRPTIALTQHEDLVVDRFELLYNAPFTNLIRSVQADIDAVSPETTVVPRLLAIADPWDFEQVYAALLDFARDYPFDLDAEEYWIHVTTGTHVAQICLFLMTEARFFPGRLVQTSPPRRASSKNPGEYSLIDLNLSRYDQLAQRFSLVHAEGIAFLKSGIATRNAEFNRMIEEIERVAINLLTQFSEENASKMRFNREYRARFMRFAVSPEALWSGNFRDLHASVTRMATLSESGLITDRVVDDEIARLTRLWRHGHALVAGDELTSFLGEEGAAQLDRFDAVQLQEMIAVCRTARSLSEVGCYCSPCRAAKAKPNDADRLKKYLARVDLDWDQVSNERFTPRTSRPSTA